MFYIYFPNKILICTIFVVFFLHLDANGQNLSTELDLIFETVLSDEGSFWLEHNRNDLIPGSSAAQIGIYNKGEYQLAEGFGFLWAGEFYGRTDASLRARPVHQAYAGLSHNNWLLTFGWREDQVGIVNNHLSAGPTIWSGNARPMPKVKLELKDFSPIPLTDGWLSVKGGFAHGWFESSRVVTGALLHEKYAYLKMAKAPFPQAYVGLVHMAQWGGVDTSGNFGSLPQGFSDYFRVITGKEGGDTAPQMDQNNAMGNHLGSWEAGIRYQFRAIELLINRSTIFEDGTGFKLWSPEDGLWGVNIRRNHTDSFEGSVPDGNAFTAFTWEFWHTKSQSGAGPGNRPANWEGHPQYDAEGNRFGGRDNYFNHGLYYNGWSYHGRTIGVPFITYDPDSGRMINNRMIGHHLGFMHSRPEWFVKVLYSWTRNYGTYDLRYDSPFEEPLAQHYMLFSFYSDLTSSLNIPISLTAEVGLDHGDFLGNRKGILLTVEYSLLR